MARSRNIKPGFFTNDDLGELEPLARLLFAGLWCHADREGRLEDRPKRLKAEILPYDNCDINLLVQFLHDAKFVLRYVVDGIGYIQILKFKEHQNPHMKEAPSVIPAPDKHSASTVRAPVKNESSRADSLNLIPDSLNPISSANAEADNDPWIIGKQFLAKRMTPTTVGPFLGKLCRDHGNDAVIEALQAAIVNEPADVKSYLVGILRGKSSKGKFDPVAYNARTL